MHATWTHLELGQHALQAAVGEDVAGVDEAVDGLGGVLNALDLLVGQVFVLLVVKDELQRRLVVGHKLVDAGEVELVLDVSFLHLRDMG